MIATALMLAATIWPAVHKKPFAGAYPDIDRAQRDRQLPGCSSERVGHDTVPGIRRVDLKNARAVALDEQQAVPSLERVKHVGHAHARRLGDALGKTGSPRDKNINKVRLQTRPNAYRSRATPDPFPLHKP